MCFIPITNELDGFGQSGQVFNIKISELATLLILIDSSYQNPNCFRLHLNYKKKAGNCPL